MQMANIKSVKIQKLQITENNIHINMFILNTNAPARY